MNIEWQLENSVAFYAVPVYSVIHRFPAITSIDWYVFTLVSNFTKIIFFSPLSNDVNISYFPLVKSLLQLGFFDTYLKNNLHPSVK